MVKLRYRVFVEPLAATDIFGEEKEENLKVVGYTTNYHAR
jgi:hypothetical protein